MLSRLTERVDPLRHTLGQALLAGAAIDGRRARHNNGSGLTPSWFATGTHRGRGITGDVFVKCDTRRNAELEVAAYHVARLSGLVDVAPCTVRRAARWTTERAGDARVGMIVAMNWLGYEVIGEYGASTNVFKRRCLLFDYLIRNGDRHYLNIMRRGSHEVAVDHAIAFGESTWDRFGLCEIHRADWPCVQRLRESPILDLLAPLLTNAEIALFVARLANLKPKQRGHVRNGRQVG